jgi:hypothetical protein
MAGGQGHGRWLWGAPGGNRSRPEVGGISGRLCQRCLRIPLDGGGDHRECAGTQVEAEGRLKVPTMSASDFAAPRNVE